MSRLWGSARCSPRPARSARARSSRSEEKKAPTGQAAPLGQTECSGAAPGPPERRTMRPAQMGACARAAHSLRGSSDCASKDPLMRRGGGPGLLVLLYIIIGAFVAGHLQVLPRRRRHRGHRVCSAGDSLVAACAARGRPQAVARRSVTTPNEEPPLRGSTLRGPRLTTCRLL